MSKVLNLVITECSMTGCPYRRKKANRFKIYPICCHPKWPEYHLLSETRTKPIPDDCPLKDK